MAIVNKCPYCYRPLGVWKHDPLLLPDGSKYKWSDETHLVLVPDIKNRIYKGMYQITESEIIELQNHRKALEEELLPEDERTKFSPVNESGKFQITIKHIKELRESTEKLLTEMGFTKEDYFNYDEDMNHIIHPAGDKTEWYEPTLEANKFQCKNLHIEDLRHNIPLSWIETWEKGTTPEFTKSVFIHVDSWYEGKEEYINFNADHDWNGSIYVFGQQIAGAAWGEATSIFNLIKSPIPPWSTIHWIGQARAHAGWGYYCGGQSRAALSGAPFYDGLNSYIIQPKIKSKPNVRLSFKGIYDFNWNYTITEGLPIPSEPYHHVMITVLWAWNLPQYWETLGVVRYVVGTHPSGYGAEIPITIEEFKNFDRNLYEDYILSHGGTPPHPSWEFITYIEFRGDTTAGASTNWIPGEVFVESNLQFKVDDIKLFYQA